jgi:hypothetical protein
MSTRLPAALLFTTALTALSACQTTTKEPVARTRETPSAVPAPVTTAVTNRETYASPEAALDALKNAAKRQDRDALRGIFGPEIDRIAVADPVEQKAALQRFADRLSEKAHVETTGGGSTATVFIGATEYPLPIPLVKDPQGKWFFDTQAGEKEILLRRIGRNELDTIDFCRAFTDAQREYASRDHDGDGIAEYARRLVSSPGKHDGLYWPATSFEPQSPLGPLAAQAAAEGYLVNGQNIRAQNGQSAAEQTSGPHPFHGYYFKVLTKQGPAAPGGAYNYLINGHMVGGFAFVAYPAEYGKSGVMTFIINQNNQLYQKDLGTGTAAKARAMAAFNPDSGWTPVKDTPTSEGATATRP